MSSHARRDCEQAVLPADVVQKKPARTLDDEQDKLSPCQVIPNATKGI